MPSTLTYAHQPSISADDVDLAPTTEDATIKYKFNIASLVQKWQTGENYGVVIDTRMAAKTVHNSTNYLGQRAIQFEETQKRLEAIQTIQ